MTKDRCNVILLILLEVVILCVAAENTDCGRGYKDYKVIIIVKKTGPQPCKIINGTLQCRSLVDALKDRNVSNTCIVLWNSQFLHNHTSIVSVQNFKIVGHYSSAYLYCNFPAGNHVYNKDVGLSIKHSKNIVFAGLSFEGCGVKYDLFISAVQSQISAAVYFEDVRNITFDDVNFLSNYGYAVVIIDSSEQLNFKSVTARDNVPYNSNKTTSVYSSGGGLLLAYREDKEDISSHNEINFIDCTFKNNRAQQNYAVDDDDDEPAISTIPFSRGGAVSLIFGNYSRNNTVVFSDVHFVSNNALWGGGIYVKFFRYASSNKICFNSCTFDGNYAFYAGGGALIQGDKTDGNELEYVLCTFTQNQAKTGGGVQYSETDVNRQSSLLIYNTNFTYNLAILGFAVYTSLLNLTFYDTNIFENAANNETGKGAVATYKTHFNINGRNKIYGNTNTAFLLDNTFLNVSEYIEFSNNSGTDGGALSMYGHSLIILHPLSHIVFDSNYAENHGGAMFVSVPGPSLKPLKTTQLKRYRCFFSSHNDGLVDFKNNYAGSNEGTSIFASTLQNCMQVDLNLSNVFTNWTNFNFSDLRPEIITTEAVDIELNSVNWKKPPGLEHIFPIKLLDERNNSVSACIDLSISNKDIRIIGKYQKFVVNKGAINFAYSGPQNTSFDLTIIVPDSGAASLTLQNLILLDCPFGYIFKNNRCICKDLKHQKNGIAQCTDIGIYLYKNYWAKPNYKAHDQVMAHRCPEGYCRLCNRSETLTGAECLFHSKNQCVSTRNQTSFLCSRCKFSNMSVHLKQGSCGYCSGTKTYIFSSLIHFLIVFCIILLLIWLNNDTYTSYVNPVIYSYQIIALIIPVHFEPVYGVHFIVVIIGGSFNHQIYENCFFDGMNDLNKYWIELIAPISWIFSLWICYLVFSCVQWLKDRINRDSFFRTINIVFLISCCSIFKFAFSVLNYVIVDGEKRVFVYAAVEYKGKEHLPFFYAAIVSLCIVCIFSMVILAYTCRKSKSTYLDNYCCCFWVNPCLERSFKYGFKTGHAAKGNEKGKFNLAWFALFYVFCSATIIGLETFLNISSKMTWINMFSLFFMTVFIIAAPYKERHMNNINAIMLANVVMVTSIVDGNPYPDDDTKIVLNIFLCVPVLVLLVRLVYHVCYVSGCLQYLPNLPFPGNSGKEPSSK